MIAAPSSIQAQLGETISVIAESDFWENWQTLVDVSNSDLTKRALVDMLRIWYHV